MPLCTLRFGHVILSGCKNLMIETSLRAVGEAIYNGIGMKFEYLKKLFVVFLLASVSFAAQSSFDLMERANALYRDGKFKQAVLLYRKAEDRGADPVAVSTVTGIITLFTVITEVGTNDARVLAGGISEALVTTEMGLVIAIPVMILHGLLSEKIEKITSELYVQSTSLMNKVFGKEKK